MKKSYNLINTVEQSIICLFFLLLPFANRAQSPVIAGWTFESSQPTTAGPITAENGSGTATIVHAGNSVYTSPSGNGSAHSWASTNWTVGDYYQFTVVPPANIGGFYEFLFEFDGTPSSDGPANFNLLVSTDGINYTYANRDAPSISIKNDDSWSSTNYDNNSHYTKVFSMNNISTNVPIYLKLQLANSTSISGGVITTNSELMIDNIKVSVYDDTGNYPLPITLASFTATKSANDITLNWVTSSEQNASFFQVERSLNGRTFDSLGIVMAKNSSLGGIYSYEDKESTGGVYYRLKMVDVNGAYKYSNVIQINGNNIVSLLSSVTTGDLQINMSGYKKIDLRIVGISGTVMLRQSVSGAGMQTVHTGNLPKGLYFLQVADGSMKQTLKFIKQ